MVISWNVKKIRTRKWYRKIHLYIHIVKKHARAGKQKETIFPCQMWNI